MVQGCVFLQTVFINLLSEEELKEYVPEIVDCILTTLKDGEEGSLFKRPISMLLLTLLWYD